MPADRNTMKAISQRTGFSLSSVSRALDPMRAHLVKRETRETILGVARQLRIAPNISARRLKLNCSETITAVFYEDLPQDSMHSHEFDNVGTAREDLRQLNSLLRSCNWDLKIEYINEKNPLDSRAFDRNRTAGLLFYGVCDEASCEHLRKSGLPGVLMSRGLSAKSVSGISKVRINREPGYRQALNFLRAQGFRRIGWVAASREEEHNRSIFEAILQEYGLLQKENCFSAGDYFDLRLSAEKLGQMDAVFCRNDAIANWLLREFRYRKLVRIPRIIGYDNDPWFACQKRDFDTIGLAGNPLPELSLTLLRELIRTPELPPDRFDVVLPTRFLPVGGICPEHHVFVEQTLNALNIKPVFPQKAERMRS